MQIKEELEEYNKIVEKVKESINNLQKYKGNKHYKTILDMKLKELNRTHKFFRAKIENSSSFNIPFDEKFKILDEAISKILSSHEYKQKLDIIGQLEMFWPELEVEFENLKLKMQSFEIPLEIPMTEYRLDVEEAIKDFDNGCFISSLVLSRRAYEGALVKAYMQKEKKEPIEEMRCKNCKTTIREKSYFGISKLHEWAIKQGLVTDRLKQVGFLLSDMGSGAAHPPLTDFKRDKEIARLGITATITLLKELNTNGVKNEQ